MKRTGKYHVTDAQVMCVVSCTSWRRCPDAVCLKLLKRDTSNLLEGVIVIDRPHAVASALFIWFMYCCAKRKSDMNAKSVEPRGTLL